MTKFLASIFIFLLLSPCVLFAAPKNTLFVSSVKKTALLGENFTVEVYAATPNQAMNAVSGTLKFTDAVRVVSISTTGSIVNFWIENPQVLQNSISFEGVILNPGYQGNHGTLFTVTFNAQKNGTVPFIFSQGALLANDGLGTNILNVFSSTTVRVGGGFASDGENPIIPEIATIEQESDGTQRLVALPVITEYPTSVDSAGKVVIRGKGEPSQLTKLSFKDTSFKSLGEQFITALQTKKNVPADVLLKNNENGIFEYVSAQNLLTGVYNVTPALVDTKTDTEKPGFGVRILVNNSSVVKALIVILNVLALLIPIVTLIMIIYFIPWYSRLRMKIMKRKMHLEEEQINLSEEEIKRQERVIATK